MAEKQRVALTLAATPHPEYYSPYCVTPDLPKQLCNQDSFWPEDQSMPSLAPMVGPCSWQLLNMLELHGEKVAWLEQHPSTWVSDPHFIRFAEFITAMEVTGDGGERTIKLIEVTPNSSST